MAFNIEMQDTIATMLIVRARAHLKVYQIAYESDKTIAVPMLALVEEINTFNTLLGREPWDGIEEFKS